MNWLTAHSESAGSARHRDNAMSWKRTLAAGLLAASVAGCHHATMPPRPTSPTLDVQVTEDGGMCLERGDTEALGVYIQELERGYER